MKSIYRIIDANLNRALEGLRVVEEITRFILDNKALTLRIKKLRHQVSQAVGSLDLLKARKVRSDVGRRLYTKREGSRKTVRDIFHSNIKRAEEAVRVLEEFSKLIDPKLGKSFKAMRMQAYQIEKLVGVKLERADL